MPFKMMYGHYRFIERKRQGFGKGAADEQRSGQARACGISNRVDFLQRQIRLGQRLPQQGHDTANMVPRGKLRHNTAVGGMHGDLSMQRLPQQLGSAGLRIQRHQRYTGFVAGRFHTQHQGGAGLAIGQIHNALRAVHGRYCSEHLPGSETSIPEYFEFSGFYRIVVSSKDFIPALAVLPG